MPLVPDAEWTNAVAAAMGPMPAARRARLIELLGDAGGRAESQADQVATVVDLGPVSYTHLVNAIAPAARTRMTEQTPGLSDIVQAPADASVFDSWDPANVSPLVAYLSTEGCTATGRVYFVQGGQIRLFQPWTMTDTLEKADRWTVAELQAQMHPLVG